MKKYTLIVGIERDKDGKTLAPGNVRLYTSLIEKHLAEDYGGFTRTEHVGGYKHSDGRVVYEKSLSYSVLDFESRGSERARLAGKLIKKYLRQESVLFTVKEVKAELI